MVLLLSNASQVLDRFPGETKDSCNSLTNLKNYMVHLNMLPKGKAIIETSLGPLYNPTSLHTKGEI